MGGGGELSERLEQARCFDLVVFVWEFAENGFFFETAVKIL